MLLLALATVVLALFGYRLAGQTLREWLLGEPGFEGPDDVRAAYAEVLLARLDLKLGDHITVGNATFQIPTKDFIPAQQAYVDDLRSQRDGLQAGDTIALCAATSSDLFMSRRFDVRPNP